MCSFLGPDSQAAPGMCTDTPGYLADAEIQAIIDDDANNTITFYDEVSGAEILVYDGKCPLMTISAVEPTTKFSPRY